ncbi:sensor histidine kinase [Polyangium jinanense]|uniref:histidine kinase n=1 Tax=Polyangium jinanense TaxID=2829994 RepID=A0A9X3XFU4_9BACT|nr:HAMP domain-containing sensor histidine kinase [Polyangium jinanense]MDC3959734.1 HAMP domain-containing histidine kinase [Polyangium jinanense]MDC3989522.1 HAMP domain-containing histidine kinase [Polyangium jinanense]
MARRKHSLRRRTFAVVLAVVLAPVGIVFGARYDDAGEEDRMRARVLRAAEAARSIVATNPDASSTLAASIEEAAAGERVRLRVIDGAGVVVADHDHEPATSLRDRIGDLFFGPDGAPTLRTYEELAPRLAERPEVQRALAEGHAEGCERALGGKLLVCHAALRVPLTTPARVVLAQKSSPRVIRAISDVRYPLLKLSFFVLVGGLALAWWLGRRIVRPIEELRAEVLDRASRPLSGPPIPVREKDEFGDLAGAFNTLLAAIAERSQKNHAFMADLVHELKSPVAAVRAAAEALPGEGPPNPARIERLRQVLFDSSKRLDALVSQFLELARAEAGLPSEERTALDAAELVAAIASALQKDERHAGITFELDAAPAPVEVVPARIEAAVRNLLDNAADFAGEGGTVRARVRAEAGQCVIEVEDTGPGIPPENLPRIFDRFFTDRPAGKGQGTGLGLALAKAIVEAHGGSLVAASKPGKGALFLLRLPLVSHGVHIPSDDVSPPR